MLCNEAIKMVVLANVKGIITDTQINGLILLHLTLMKLPRILTNKVSVLVELIREVT